MNLLPAHQQGINSLTSAATHVERFPDRSTSACRSGSRDTIPKAWTESEIVVPAHAPVSGPPRLAKHDLLGGSDSYGCSKIRRMPVLLLGIS
ncbi:hypothetical protein BaRGS_00034527 [Batillaria attramentaria]|uniref:Uncharacterized protein n=1 Tax=Batillaria attramentaria TaxID=370345 RepID=A0ABD0JHJ2_9CAEN